MDMMNNPLNSSIHEAQTSIARKLQISESTVRNRLREGGEIARFFRGWSAVINPSTIDSHSAHLYVDVEPPSLKVEVIHETKLIDGVWYIANLHGDELGFGLLYEDEKSLEEKVELISSISRSEHVDYSEIIFPQSDYQFTYADLVIMKAAQGNPWQTFESVAERAGLSTRTVKRRLSRMIEARAFYLTPILNYKSLAGAIGADLMVFYEDIQVARRAEKEIFSIVESFLLSAIRGRVHSYFPLILRNVSQATEITNHIKEVDGVKRAFLGLVDEHIPLYHVFLEQIEALLRPQRQVHSAPPNRLRIRA